MIGIGLTRALTFVGTLSVAILLVLSSGTANSSGLAPWHKVLTSGKQTLVLSGQRHHATDQSSQYSHLRNHECHRECDHVDRFGLLRSRSGPSRRMAVLTSGRVGAVPNLLIARSLLTPGLRPAPQGYIRRGAPFKAVFAVTMRMLN